METEQLQPDCFNPGFRNATEADNRRVAILRAEQQTAWFYRTLHTPQLSYPPILRRLAKIHSESDLLGLIFVGRLLQQQHSGSVIHRNGLGPSACFWRSRTRRTKYLVTGVRWCLVVSTQVPGLVSGFTGVGPVCMLMSQSSPLSNTVIFYRGSSRKPKGQRKVNS